jgi:hypothetical protein
MIRTSVSADGTETRRIKYITVRKNYAMIPFESETADPSGDEDTMSRKTKDKAKRKTSGRENKSGSPNRTILIAAGILVFLALAYFYFNQRPVPKPVSEANVNVDPDMLPGIQITEAPWEAEHKHLRERLNIIGLPALLEEGTSLHAHQHLDLFIHGKSVPVPAMIGVNVVERYISPIHTHDGSGEIHIESPTVQNFTLGQFFDVWGVRFTQKCIGSHCEDPQNSLRVFVNGQAEAGDPRRILLSDHQEIVVAYGTAGELPSPIPSEHRFSPGA